MGKKFLDLSLNELNRKFDGMSPEEIIAWAIENSGKMIVCSTNFGPREGVVLHMAAKIFSEISILWVDGGYATKKTYRFAEKLISDLKLNVRVYTPRLTSARREALFGEIPTTDDEEAHRLFTEQVKLEPFRRALGEMKPKIWLNSIRAIQTEHRASLAAASEGPDGILKISPVFNWSDEEMDRYLSKHEIPNETDYYDPTKVWEKRECGLHLIK